MATTLKPYNSSNNTVMMAQMALTGMGAAILPEWLIEDEIAQGRLVKLFEQPFSSVSIYAVYMNRAFLNLKIRLFIDFLGDNLIKTISVKND
jgi:DNA-binding transcriptional LysR family regulator